MKILYQRIVFVCAVLFSTFFSLKSEVDNISGIVFRGNDYDVDSRTSLRIPGHGQLLWNGNHLKLEFDLKISRHGDHFGYICSIGAGDGEVVSLFLTNPKSGSPYLCTVDDGGRLRPVRTNGDTVDIYDWNRISFDFRSSGDSILISENGQVMFAKRREQGTVPLTIIFGKGYFSGKSCIDVAPMEIRDISLSLGDGDIYEFPLDRTDTADSIVYDKNDRLPARLENHEWIIDRHSRWKHVRSISHSQKAYPVAASGSPVLYLVTGDRIIKVDLVKQRVADIRYKGDNLDMNRLSGNFIVIGSPREEQLVYYSINETDSSKADISRFNPETGSWIPAVKPEKLSSYINHSRYLADNDSVVVQMFGYGYHSYKNGFNRINLTDGMVETDRSVLKDVAPRYLSAIGRVDDHHVVIYGGIGNMYGDQEFGTKMFDDLYMLDTDNDSLVTLLKNNGDIENGIAVDNMLYDAEENKVTGLFFTPFKATTSLTLKELDVKTGNMRILSDSIPYQFSDINSSAMLIHLSKTDMLYAVTVSRDADGQGYTTDIYTLQLPLLPFSAGMDRALINEKDGVSRIWIAVAAVLLVTGLFLIRRTKAYRRRRASGAETLVCDTPVSGTETAVICEMADTEDDCAETEAQPDAVLSPGVSLLGGFKVVNRTGDNITGSFTPILRQILILVILYTEKNGEGISNSSLKDCLWYDKSDESFLNNRSVNMRKLRVLLPEIGDFRLGVSHGNWSLEAEDGKLVDYFAVMSIVRSIHEKGCVMDSGRVRRLLEYASRGPLLPECQYEWLDSFKGEYSDMMIQILHRVLDSDCVMEDQELTLGIVNCILQFDSIDEDAVRTKCRILMNANRVGSAAKTFDRFVKEYSTLMNEPFGLNFNEFVE